MKVELSATDVAPIIPRTDPPKEMISISKMEDGRTKVRINSSSLDVIQTCMRKAQYSLYERWISENEAPPTLFGSAIHAAMEVFYSGNPDLRVLPKYEDMELMGYGHSVPGEDTELLLQATKAFIKKAKKLEALPETDKRSIQNGVYILHEYFKTYLKDPYVALVDKDGPFVERKFSFILADGSDLVIEYFGTIDLCVKHIHTGEILIADHKTASQVGAEFYNRLKPNAQYTGYLLASIRAFGLTPSGFLINCIQVKNKPVRKGTPGPHFPRQVTTRDDYDFVEFTEQVLWAVKKYLEAIQYGVWPLGPVNACAMYGGCHLLSVCSSPQNLRENVLKSKFTKHG